MRKLRAIWQTQTALVSCAWCLTDMMILTLEEVKATGNSALRCANCNGINELPQNLIYAARYKQPKVDPDNPPGRAAAFDSIVGNIVLKRALEIALLGHHTMTYVGLPNIAWSQVSAILGARAFQITKCPCGYFQSSERECICTLPDIEKWRNSRRYEDATNSDMLIEVLNPQAKELFSWSEPYTSVALRIKKTRFSRQFHRRPMYGKPNVNPHYQQTTDFLYRMKERLNMDMTQLQSMARVAITIAEMDSQDFVSIVHAAEAAGYKSALLNY